MRFATLYELLPTLLLLVSLARLRLSFSSVYIRIDRLTETDEPCLPFFVFSVVNVSTYLMLLLLVIELFSNGTLV